MRPRVRLNSREAWRIHALALIAGLSIVPSVGKMLWPTTAIVPTKDDQLQGRDVSPLQGLWLGQKLDLNSASAASLQIVPGIGAALSKRIVDDREANGEFFQVDDVERVKGIGPVLRKRLTAYVEVSRRGPDRARRGSGKAEAESDRPPSTSTTAD